jgi:hypothetical protein
MPIYSLKARLFRIKQANGLNLSTALTTSPSRFTYSAALFVFHQISRPAGPGKQATRTDACPTPDVERVQLFPGHYAS